MSYPASVTYNGSRQKNPVTIEADGKKLSDREYSIAYKKNKNAGKAVFSIKLKKEYKPDRKAFKGKKYLFTIMPMYVEAAEVIERAGRVTKVKVGGKKVGKKMYDVDTSQRMIFFKGNYSGSVSY